MIISFSESDVQQSLVVPEAWYLVLIESVEDKSSNDQKSTNSWITGKILKNDDTGETSFKSRNEKGEEVQVSFAGAPTPFPWLINSKGAWAAVGLMNSAFGDVVKAGERRDTNALPGRKVVGFIGKTIYKGKTKNEFTDQWRAPKPEDK